MYKLEVVCPFCLETTKKWQFVKLVPKTFIRTSYTKMDGQWVQTKTKINTQDVPNESEILKWESDVLKLHLPKCTNAVGLSSAVLEHYKLI
jgi:hypothetical protein